MMMDPTMSVPFETAITLQLGVTIARESVDSPWQDHIWRPMSVFLDASPVTAWRLLEQRPGFEHFHVATLPLELHRKETPGYIANLTSSDPGIYLVIRHGSDTPDGTEPVHVHMITASAHDVEAYGHMGEEIIGKVAFPEPVLELLEAFIAHHHTDETFKKRRRTQHHQAEAHQFGQEPIHLLRERMRKAGLPPSDKS
jgi:Protein of unknown function (DUF3305)